MEAKNFLDQFLELITPFLKKIILEVLKDYQSLSTSTSALAEDDFLDAHASARYIGESLSSFYRRTSNKELPFYKRGKRVFCKKSELKAWMEAGKSHSRTEIRQQFQQQSAC